MDLRRLWRSLLAFLAFSRRFFASQISSTSNEEGDHFLFFLDDFFFLSRGGDGDCDEHDEFEEEGDEDFRRFCFFVLLTWLRDSFSG